MVPKSEIVAAAAIGNFAVEDLSTSFHIFPHLSTVNFEVHHQSSHIPQRVLRRSWQLLPGAECSFGVVYSM